MIDAPYEFDIDHPVMPSTPDIPHQTLETGVLSARSPPSGPTVISFGDCRCRFDLYLSIRPPVKLMDHYLSLITRYLVLRTLEDNTLYSVVST